MSLLKFSENIYSVAELAMQDSTK